MVIGVLLLLPAVFSPAASSTIQTSVGAGVRLSCPMAATASQCQTRACTWTGPGGVRVSGGEQDERLHVEYDRDTCECVLSIRVTSLSHAGVWRCSLENVTIEDKELTINKGDTEIFKESNKSSDKKKLFYILFIVLAVLAKILLLAVIIISIVMSCCPPSGSRLGGSRSRGSGDPGAAPGIWREEKHAHRVFNARMCDIE